MLDLLELERLREGKVLLAYSGGVDSTALFHLLLSHHIDFDIAHVNYHTRAQSDAEAQSAEELASRHNLQCYVHSCPLEGNNFEHRAREERYRFFRYLIDKHHYRYLVTAHQLNDRLEWLLMQLCRGAGLPELLGVRSHDSRDGMNILRPLLEHDRESIEIYLHAHQIPYFIDQSNSDESYTRNRFRHQFSNPMMREYRDAIRRSFRYLEEDNTALIEEVQIHTLQDLYAFANPNNAHSHLHAVDRIFKSLGHVMSAPEKERLKHEICVIIGRRYVVWRDQQYTFIGPYKTNEVLEKKFKEICRVEKIEPKMRGYLAAHSDAFNFIRRLRDAQTPLQSE